jgi:hypothetical protein
VTVTPYLIFVWDLGKGQSNPSNCREAVLGRQGGMRKGGVLVEDLVVGATGDMVRLKYESYVFEQDVHVGGRRR